MCLYTMQYIAGNNTPTRSYHSVSPNAPSHEGGGGVSEMLLGNPTLVDNLLQQSGQCGFDRLVYIRLLMVVCH